MTNNVEKFNFLWKTNFTEEEYQKILKENPTLWGSYSLQSMIAKKYNRRDGETYGNKTRYCEKCGEVMTQIEFSEGFDRFTGKPKPWIRYVCPTLNWEEMLVHPQFNVFANTYKGHYYFAEKQYE